MLSRGPFLEYIPIYFLNFSIYFRYYLKKLQIRYSVWGESCCHKAVRIHLRYEDSEFEFHISYFQDHINIYSHFYDSYLISSFWIINGKDFFLIHIFYGGRGHI